MTRITCRADILTYVVNTRYDAHALGLSEDLVDAIQIADHPAYGTDWAEWLSANVEALVSKMTPSPSRYFIAEIDGARARLFALDASGRIFRAVFDGDDGARADEAHRFASPISVGDIFRARGLHYWIVSEWPRAEGHRHTNFYGDDVDINDGTYHAEEW